MVYVFSMKYVSEIENWIKLVYYEFNIIIKLIDDIVIKLIRIIIGIYMYDYS